MPFPPALRHALTSVVFPNPGGAERSVSEPCRPVWRRSSRSGRGTSAGRRGGGASLVASSVSPEGRRAAAALGRARTAPDARGVQEGGALVPVQSQRGAELRHGLAVRPAAGAALQVADGAHAHARPLGQRLLREAGRDPVASQQFAERRRL